MRAIGYARCSTQEQADSGLGLEAQEQRIRSYCALRDCHATEIISDRGVSGGKRLADRDGGRRLLDVLRSGQAQAVVMLKLDRGFRNAGDCLNTVEQWDRAGVSLHVIDLGGIPTAFLWRRDRRPPPNHCLACGYNLTALTEPRCPECGTAFATNNKRDEPPTDPPR